MRRSLAFILLAAGSLAAGGSALCFAADAASSTGAATPGAAPAARPSQREMHHMQQTNSEEQRPGDAAEDQSTGDDHTKSDDQQNEDQNQDTDQRQEAAAETQSFVAPAPSQRSMHQQLRDARQNQAPAAGHQ